ncbi:hypothetical protein R3P38DRAFT_2769053 [Favolaschia claudopus]|uniref:Uncharacterized protein n=1 Tax=Favolaschia claudopus TaxID=2862362 RepID=A0AAW0CN69_9AGAR
MLCTRLSPRLVTAKLMDESADLVDVVVTVQTSTQSECEPVEGDVCKGVNGTWLLLNFVEAKAKINHARNIDRRILNDDRYPALESRKTGDRRGSKVCIIESNAIPIWSQLFPKPNGDGIVSLDQPPAEYSRGVFLGVSSQDKKGNAGDNSDMARSEDVAAAKPRVSQWQVKSASTNPEIMREKARRDLGGWVERWEQSRFGIIRVVQSSPFRPYFDFISTLFHFYFMSQKLEMESTLTVISK